MSETTTTEVRRFWVHWHYGSGDTGTDIIIAKDQREARRIYRARTRHLGYGVTILRITVHPDDRKPSPIGRKGAKP
jgi:hypothetical protein